MQDADFLAIARAILAQPTAPFYEDAVAAEITRQLTKCRHVRLLRDEGGNLVARYRRGPTRTAPFAFAAHMDHPGYVGRRFLGGVPLAWLRSRAATERFGPFRMWALPAFSLRKGRIHSRACDDLIGCAAIVAMLRALDAGGAECAVDGLFTRAEEVGFIGALQLAQSGLISKRTSIVSLETSSVKGGPVEIGAGVIIRVGDRTSIFDSATTATLLAIAQKEKIPHQRALMQGGTCEATAYALHGYTTAALCVALGNYHNCAPAHRIAAEYVSASDAVAMARLCMAAALAPASNPHSALRERLEQRVEAHRSYFRPLKI